MHPPNLHLKHFQELALCSGINRDLAALNFNSLEGEAAYDCLLISDRLPRNNSGQVSNGWLRRYSHVVTGGWWCSGLDPLDNWSSMEWGCFKPNHPRQDENGKLIKYEHPPCTATRIFCLRVTLAIWRQMCIRYEVPLPENIIVTETGEALGFWQWVLENKIPIIVCEGVKKAAALLSLGYVAIALPGITSGYRVTKDLQGKVVSRQLIPELAVFTQSNNSFYICFDYETQPNKIKAINNAIAQLGQLLEAQGTTVKVIRLPGTEKGVDDFIVSQGSEAFQVVYESAIDLEIDLAKNKLHTELTYFPNLTLNKRYLGELPFPQSGLVGIKSAKGTGKTTALEAVVKEAKKTGKPVLLLTHRIQLGRFLCQKVGVNWINSKTIDNRQESSAVNLDKESHQSIDFVGVKHCGNKSITNRESQSSAMLHPHSSSISNYPSLGLCIDSIWKLNPDTWKGGIIILDEVEQSLWHLLNSDTCKDKRVKILKAFQQLISTVLHTNGLVIAQDANLSDLSLDYLKSIAGVEIEPWVVLNEWKPEKGWQVNFYDSPNPTLLIQQLELDLIAGLKCYVTTDSRSGRYSSETINSYIKQRLEQFQKQYPKTLVVSSQTTNKLGHEAANFIENINEKAKDYDAVFVTPSLGTGVSIDVLHFDRVYGIFQGVISDWEARQALARVRDNVPRVIWCAKRGVGLIGSGSTNYRSLSHWYQENQKENLALMSPLHKVDVDLPLVYDLIHLRTWAKFAAKVNGSITLYRQSLKEGLLSEGHQVNLVSNHAPIEQLKDLRQALIVSANKDWETSKKILLAIVKLQNEFADKKQKANVVKTKIKKLHYQLELETACAVANSADIKHTEYERLLSKCSLTDVERHKINKYILQQRYGVKVTPDLKLRDDKGYYGQLLTHYYLTHDCEYFRIKDLDEWNHYLEVGEGKVFLPDLQTYTLKIEALKSLGMGKFLHPEREFQDNDADLIALKEKAIWCSKHVQRAIGINVLIKPEIEDISSIKILSRLLKVLGLKLKLFKYNNSGYESRVKVYQIDPETLFDGRQEIFAVWHFRDSLKHRFIAVSSQLSAVSLARVSE